MSLEMHMDHLDSGILDYHISSVAITESSSQVSSNSSNVRQKRQYESIALCTVVRVAFYKLLGVVSCALHHPHCHYIAAALLPHCHRIVWA